MKTLIAANFKMNKTPHELEEYLKIFKQRYACFVNVDLMIAPVSVGLGIASELLKDSCIYLGAQNMYFEESGAYTGEISPKMLSDINCKYVILGHSERRKYFGETNEIINKKVLAALKHNIRPILCIGETLEQKEKNITKEILKIQLLEGLYKVDDYSKVDIAYEPVWTIGSGKSASGDYIEEIHSFIRSVLLEHNTSKNNDFRILYGGSVNEKNAGNLFKIKNVNGFLVGSASLNPEKLLAIAEEVIK